MTRSLVIYSNGNVQVREQFYRKPHDPEIYNYNTKDWRYGGDGYRLGPVRQTVIDDNANMPEVYRLQPEHVISLPCAAVRLIRDINNPLIGVKQISSLLNWNYAFSNHTGFPDRYNCLTGDGAGQKDPALDQPRLCGGAVVRPLRIENGLLYFDYIDTAKPLPTAQEVISKPWLWFWVTGITESKQINIATKRGSDGQNYPVRMPLFAEVPLYAPLAWFHKLPLGFWPPAGNWMAT